MNNKYQQKPSDPVGQFMSGVFATCVAAVLVSATIWVCRWILGW